MSDQRFIKRTLNKNVSPKQRVALVILAEEAAELVQAVTKLLRHGPDSYNPFHPELGSNEEQLGREWSDVQEAMRRVEASFRAAPSVSQEPER